MIIKPAALTALLILGASACGAGTEDFQKQAAGFLRTKAVTDKLGVKIVTSSCAKPAKIEIGQTFECTGTSENGTNYVFVSTITGDKSFEITTAREVAATETSASPTTPATGG